MEIVPEVLTKTMRKVLNEIKSLSFIKELLFATPQIETKQLAKHLCAKYSFIAPNSEPQVSSCVAVLKDFHKSGKITLPNVKENSSRKFTAMLVSDDSYPLPENFPKAVHDLISPIEIEKLEHGDKEKGLIYNNLMHREHPLANTRQAGYLVKYLIKYNGCYIGACAYSGCSINLEARDNWIGWSKDQKLKYQNNIINMSRFLIRKDIHCENLASHLLSKLNTLIRKDWIQEYSITPWLVESFVDTENYSGTCYKAANWKCLGQTKGRGRNDTAHENAKSIKDIYIYILEPTFREMGNFPPEPTKYSPMKLETKISSDEWASHEFGNNKLGDKRIVERVVSIAHLKSLCPSQSFPAAAKGERKLIAGYYTLLDNDRPELTPEAILENHRDNTICRAMCYKDIISAHDTTTFNFKGLEETEGLGPIGTNEKSVNGANGLNAHVTLACNREGIPLGILAVDYVPPREFHKKVKGKKKGKKEKKAFEETEIFRWIKGYLKDVDITGKTISLRITSVMDRESDFFELLIVANGHRVSNPIIIRCKHNRQVIMADGSRETIKSGLEKSKNILKRTIRIPPQRKKMDRKTGIEYPSLKERDAEVEIRYETVEIVPPKIKKFKTQKPIRANILHIKELNPPPGAKEIEWYLSTTREIHSVEDVYAIVEDYKLRWKIEELFRTGKSGCKMESQKLNHADKIKKVISISFVVAWRIMLLTTLSRKAPDMPSDKAFTKNELEVLSSVVKKKVKTIKEAVNAVATLGGYQNRKNDLPPGNQLMWLGFSRLSDIIYGYIILKNSETENKKATETINPEEKLLDAS